TKYAKRSKKKMTRWPEETEATVAIGKASVTEGAVGDRSMEVMSGKKAMASIRLSEGGTPPFGAEVYNSRQKQLGIVGEDGSVYLNGINPGERLQVKWEGKTQRKAKLPVPLPGALFSGLFLPSLRRPSSPEPT
ncbi:FimD/PapC C-terminal domain-containing protein, partial [Salmonella enterica]|uniref:FimD/PapC C-terminal domain-containing protein n=1 Tax=Salmonella enterica TaxID=28901 RepID=UPI00398C4A17